ncbi:hypothetical protein OTK49_20690 [Vibrio coralliirubri]|uniref:hypothetical protein n=1 Tax=Vibrio coralliirubri TaxID=1516159 RepID=UPI002283F89B|nr:hypothetical protein [Vibrio coralliirubri]MCY9864936.1 hypothetical protein [Vibrio coralliirubri]
MSQFFTLATLSDNAAKHTLEQINECESLIVGYQIELNETQEENWRTKETMKLLADQTAIKKARIQHLNECFNINYGAELHQSLAHYKHLLSVISNCQNMEWCNAMWLSEEDAKTHSDLTKALAEKAKQEIVEVHKVTESQLEAAI